MVEQLIETMPQDVREAFADAVQLFNHWRAEPDDAPAPTIGFRSLKVSLSGICDLVASYKNEPLPVMEILKTIACFRFILPRQEIMIAGGRTVNLRDAQSMIFMAGASALMVGNYLTTLNQPVEKDLQMLKDLGLDPNWDSHDFSDQEETGCGCENKMEQAQFVNSVA